MNTVIEPIGEIAPVDDAALPLEWAQWAEEPGKVIRFEQDGGTVGRVHAVLVARGEGWIEGLWVSPERRRGGLGRQLLKAAEDLVRGYGAAVIFGAVPAHNTGALAVLERTGFEVYTHAAVLVLAVPREGVDADRVERERHAAVRRATAHEALSVSALVASGQRAWRDLVPIGWRFRRIGVDLMRGLARDGRVFVTQESGGAAVVSVQHETAVVAALVGTVAHRRVLLDVISSSANATRVVVFAPDASTTDDLGVAADPHAWCPKGLVIVQKTLAR